MLPNKSQAPGIKMADIGEIFAVTAFVVSVKTMLVYETLIRRRAWPEGQTNAPALGALPVMQAWTRPFFGLNVAFSVMAAETVSLLAA